MKKNSAIMISVMTMAGSITFNTAIAANGSTVIEIDKRLELMSQEFRAGPKCSPLPIRWGLFV